MIINFKKLDDKAKNPVRGSEFAAGYDLYAASEDGFDIIIPPHETMMVHTYLSMSIPKGYFGGIFARSGLAAKRKLRPGNCVGIVDADYRGEVMIALHNDGDGFMAIKPGERIAQLVILPFMEAEFNEVDELEQTVRGDGGFGSTGEEEIEGQVTIDEYMNKEQNNA